MERIEEILKIIELSKSTTGADWKHNKKQIKEKIEQYAMDYHEAEIIKFKNSLDNIFKGFKPMEGKEYKILKKTASRLISDKPTHL
jgi:hypothetical protein